VAFELAERMTITSERVDDELFERVRKHFSEDETVELVAIAGYENMRSKMNVALGIEAQGFCVIGAKR
jgi:alkylhydroperoxidase family enzyme